VWEEITRQDMPGYMSGLAVDMNGERVREYSVIADVPLSSDRAEWAGSDQPSPLKGAAGGEYGV
jgi:hypothetical protein